MGLFMDIVDSSIVNTVLRELVRLYRDSGDLSSRKVVVDITELSSLLKLSLRDIISSLIVLEREGFISIASLPRSLELEMAIGELLALLDWRSLRGLLDKDTYRSILDLLSRKMSSYEVDRLPELDSEFNQESLNEPMARILAVRISRLCDYVLDYVCSRVSILYDSIDIASKSDISLRGFVIELENLLSVIDSVKNTMLYRVFSSTTSSWIARESRWSSATESIITASSRKTELVDRLAEYMREVAKTSSYEDLRNIVSIVYESCRRIQSSE